MLQGFAARYSRPRAPGTENLLGTGVSIPAFGVVLNAMATSGESNILATPHIIATDNIPAEINIGENIPLQTNVGGGLGSLGGPGGRRGRANPVARSAAVRRASRRLRCSAPRQDVGNKIKVTPHINESNEVRLEIEQEISAPGAAAGAAWALSRSSSAPRTRASSCRISRRS